MKVSILAMKVRLSAVRTANAEHLSCLNAVCLHKSKNLFSLVKGVLRQVGDLKNAFHQNPCVNWHIR